MYGAIIGDVAGSYYEVVEIEAKISKKDTSENRYKRRIKILNLDTPLFGINSSYTDDTVTTLAILDATINEGNYEEYLLKHCRKEYSLGFDIYGRSRFGKNFDNWIINQEPKNSYGNGCGMRISAIGFLYNDIETIKTRTREATICSHNHVESLLCAEAITTSIYYLKNGMSKEQLYDYITKNYFSLDYNFVDLWHNYTFTSRAINSIPIAFYAFLASNSFEESIRNAISCGGDCDTIAAICGSLAESYYGIPVDLIDKVNEYLKEEQLELLNKVYDKNKIITKFKNV